MVQNSLVRFAAIDLGDERNLLIYCGPSKPKQRRDLAILFSDNEARSWHGKTVIHSGPAGYSDMVKLEKNRVGVLFEAGRMLYDEILFATIQPDNLEKRR